VKTRITRYNSWRN